MQIGIQVLTVAFAITGPPAKRARLAGPEGGLYPTISDFS